ncbi:MAG: hypothetical protein ACK5JE_09285, partial [Castellaniella sp.]|uniref:hypothetical protein n=1 Tax=Castellaniella sp. TaxID=1955812 RepID=UPI003A85FD34
MHNSKKMPKSDEKRWISEMSVLKGSVIVNELSWRAMRFGAVAATGIAMLAGSAGDVLAGTCTESSSGSGVWSCSGPASPLDEMQPKWPMQAADGTLKVTTETGFGLSVSGGNSTSDRGLNLIANKDLIFDDLGNQSSITGSIGMLVYNFGTGSVSLTSTGTVTSNQSDGKGTGIDVRNYSRDSGDLTVNVANVVGGAVGLYAEKRGTGAISVTATGIVTANNGIGSAISISNTGSIDSSTTFVSTGSVISSGAGTSGIYVLHNSKGPLTVSVHDVSSENHTAISINNSGDGSSSVYGLTSLSVDGTVRGGASSDSAGIELKTVVPSLGSVTEADQRVILKNGADVSSISGIALRGYRGNMTLDMQPGSRLTGQVLLGYGSDTVLLSDGSDFSGATFDAQHDLSSPDNDTLVFRNVTATTVMDQFIDFEKITVDGGAVTWSDLVLPNSVYSIETDLSVTHAGRFITPADFALKGSLDTSAGGIFDASAGGVHVTGPVSNAGTINLAGGAIGDELMIDGNYTGGGALLVDSRWDNPDVQVTDHLTITGDADGVTTVSVPDGIIGNVTQSEIGGPAKNGQWLAPVVTVQGTDLNKAGTFVGSAETTNAGQAQLAQRDDANGASNYYWTLSAKV